MFENLILDEADLETVVNNVTSNPDGFKLLGHLLGKAMLSDTGFNGNSRDIYNKGRRDFVITEIQLPVIQYALEKYIELLREEKKKDDSSKKG